MHSLEQPARRAVSSQTAANRSLEHRHQHTRSDAVPGNIGNIDDLFVGAFKGIHQIAAHFAARDRRAEDLVSRELSLKSWDQGTVYLARQLYFCLDSKISAALASNEIDEGDISDNDGNDRTNPENNQLSFEFLAALD